LQWRLGASRDELAAAARAFVAPGTTAVLTVHEGDRMWTSLVLAFDQEWEVTSITTADPSLVELTGPRREALDRLVAQVESSGAVVSLAVGVDRTVAEDLLAAGAAQKRAVLAGGLAAGTVSIGRAPAALTAS
jgi:hypothetical protein